MEKLIKYFTSGLFFCLMISAIAVGQDFSASLNAVGGDGTDTTAANYDLTFGFSPDATDGYDAGIDTYCPPAPPPPAFDAALSWAGDRWYTQILAGDGDLSEHVYDIALAYGADELITITWDNTGWSDMMSSCVLQDAFGGLLGIDIDMLSETSLSLDNPAFNTLKLKVTPTDYVEPPPTPSTIVVNEFLADAGTCCGAEIFGDGEDFVELYNHGDESVNIMGWGFGDTDGDVETTAPDTSIAPDGFIVLWYTGNDEAVFPEVDAKLSAGGEAIYIADADGNTVVYMEFGEQSEDISYGRVPDGADTWEYLDPPSPGETNTVESDGGNPDFSVTINVAGGDSITYYDLTVGFSPDATDDFDIGIDSYAPPAPPPPVFDAALTWSGDRYYTQILNGSADDLVEHEYGIALAYGTDNLIELSWDNTGWSDLMSACVLQDAFGGLLGIDIDMLSETSLTLNDPAFNALKLKVTPAAGSDEPDTYPVTFTVVDDGNNYQDVELKGAMTNWETVDMTNDSAGTWTLTLDLESGSYEWGAIENDGTEWGIWLPSLAGFDSNPTVVVGPDGTVSGDVGFTVPFQGGDEVTITINVDMSNEDVSADGVHIAGTMNNWEPAASPMSDDDGDGVYTASFSLVVGSTAEYKFLNGNAWGTEESVPQECSLGGFGNRYVEVPDSALVLDAVCFGGCGACALSVDESDILPEVFALRQNYPNPFNPVTTLHYNLPEQATVNIIIYDMLGRKITQLVSARQEPGYRSVQWDATDSFGNPVSAGIYLYQIQAGGFVQTRKMVLLK